MTTSRRRSRYWAVVREYAETIVVAVGLALVIRTFIMGVYKIPTGSMRPTLMEHDRILVNKFLYHFREPERGEVIVFWYPEDPKRAFIKRLIALGGDTIQLRNGEVLVNGYPLELPKVTHEPYSNIGNWGAAGDQIHVPPGSLYVLGDNSPASKDSRYWGFVPRKYLIGKAMVIFWPLTRMRLIR